MIPSEKASCYPESITGDSASKISDVARRMRIGVLTFWKSEDNYGQLLQCYATVKTLRRLGADAFLVRADYGDSNRKSFRQKIKEDLKFIYRLLPYPSYLLKQLLISFPHLLLTGEFPQHLPKRNFSEFRNKHLKCSKVYSRTELQENTPCVDVFLVGSDQIWNNIVGTFFLDWAPDDVKKIAYAASFGARESSKEFCSLIAPWLRRFDHISVREESGKKICAESGRSDSICVPDPTLLLAAEDYLNIASENYPKERYVFIYFLGTRTEIKWKDIYDFAKKRRLKIVYVASQGQIDKFEKTEASIYDWIALIAHADYVVTNSFHGTVFSLIFERKFLTYPVCGSAKNMNDRLVTLLKPLSLLERVYDGNDFQKIESHIDYEEIRREMKKNRDFGRKVLEEWI